MSSKKHEPVAEAEKVAAEEQPVAADIATDTSIEQLQQQLAEATAKALDYKDAMLRAKAESDNVKRRATLDIEKAHKHGNERFIKELLTVMDSIDQGLQLQTNSKDSQAGLVLIQKNMLSMLDKFGVVVDDPTGEKFDPSKHEAISMQPNAEVAPNTILAVMQKGFVLHGKVIRAAKVVLATAVAEA